MLSYLFYLLMKELSLRLGISIPDLLADVVFYIVSIIVGCAMLIQATFIYLHFTNPQKINDILAAKDTPSIQVLPVQNKVVAGKLAGSRNLAFGVKNILEEYLGEAGYDLTDDASTKLQVEVLYLDVLKTQMGIGVFHKNSDAVVIRLRGQVIEGGKVIRTAVIEESAAEVSMSTLLIDEGGKFNQQNLSSAIKKCSNSLVTKLLK